MELVVWSGNVEARGGHVWSSIFTRSNQKFFVNSKSLWCSFSVDRTSRGLVGLNYASTYILTA